MPTGSIVVDQLASVTSAPNSGVGFNCTVSFGGSQVVQACSNFYIEVALSDPTNTGAPATFAVQPVGKIPTNGFNPPPATPIGEPITAPGIYTVTAQSPVTWWSVELVSLSGGVAPQVSVSGVAGT